MQHPVFIHTVKCIIAQTGWNFKYFLPLFTVICSRLVSAVVFLQQKCFPLGKRMVTQVHSPCRRQAKSAAPAWRRAFAKIESDPGGLPKRLPILSGKAFVKNARYILLCDADSIVPQHRLHKIGLFFRADSEPCFFFMIFDGVGYHLTQNKVKPFGIGIYRVV